MSEPVCLRDLGEAERQRDEEACKQNPLLNMHLEQGVQPESDLAKSRFWKRLGVRIFAAGTRMTIDITNMLSFAEERSVFIGIRCHCCYVSLGGSSFCSSGCRRSMKLSEEMLVVG